MFCQNCGRQIPDGTKFCNYCGSPQTQHQSAPNSGSQYNQNAGNQYNQNAGRDISMTDDRPYDPAQQQQQRSDGSKKSGKGLKGVLISAAVILVAYLVGSALGKGSAAKMNDDSGTSSGGGSSAYEETIKDDKSSAEYEAVFAGTGIVHVPSVYGSNVASFARNEEDGGVSCEDCVYDDDGKITSIVITMYFPIQGYTDDEKAQFDSAQRQAYTKYEALLCCDISYEMGSSYYVVECKFEDLDNSFFLQELVDAGLYSEGGDYISINAERADLTSQGYVEK